VAAILEDIAVPVPEDLSSVIINVIGMEKDTLDFSDFLTVCGRYRRILLASSSNALRILVY
jgi:Ca2+-binding EF-hand superfamily protein